MNRQSEQTDARSDLCITPLPWLDDETANYLRHTLTMLVERRNDLQAAILFGSVARRMARPFDGPQPSDVDVLLIFAAHGGQQRISGAQRSAVSWTVVACIDRYPHARDLQFVLTLSTLSGWDSEFIANVARDGVLLWGRAALPDALRAVEERGRQAMSRT